MAAEIPSRRRNYRALLLVVGLALITLLVIAAALPTINSAGAQAESTPFNPIPAPLLTATALIREATANPVPLPPTITRDYIPSTTIPTVLAPLLTATALIREATQMASAGRGTSTPTWEPPTEAELNLLRARWRQSLVDAAGFDHPEFDVIVEGQIEWLNRGSFDIEEELNSVLETDIQKFDIGDAEIIVMIPRSHFSVLLDQVYVFGVTDEAVHILPFSDDVIGYVHFASTHLSDHNLNGYPEVAVFYHPGGNCGIEELQLLEIRWPEAVLNLTPALDVYGINTYAVKDLDDDGISEYLAIDRSVYTPFVGGGCNPIQVPRYYGWDGTAYVDILHTLDQSYWPTIQRYWGQLPHDAACVLPDYPMYQMLVSYRTWGRLAQGWSRLEGRLRWDACSAEVMKEYSDDMNALLRWIAQQFAE
jgi:hypothetical protein